jgi:hypothetical protein
MSDYLDVLLERAMTDKPSIRPRLPSVFEPSSQEQSPSLELLNDESNLAVTLQQNEPIQKSAVTFKLSDDGMAADQRQVLAANGADPFDARRVPVVEQKHPEKKPPLAASVIAQPRVIMQYSESTRMEQAMELADDRMIQEHRIHSEHIPPSAPSIATRMMPEADTVKITQTDGTQSLDADISQNDSGFASKAAFPVIDLWRGSAPTISPMESKEDAGDVPQQTSRVTVQIGRIEIRTARPTDTASSRRPSHAQRKPVMSLENYLNQHNKENS